LARVIFKLGFVLPQRRIKEEWEVEERSKTEKEEKKKQEIQEKEVIQLLECLLVVHYQHISIFYNKLKYYSRLLVLHDHIKTNN
jgi:hypothetical protein